MSKRLYRYIGFEDFVNLFINNKERFVSPVRWDDKNEGFLFSHFENQDDMHHIVSEMYYHLSDKNYKAIIDNYFRMWNSKWSVRAQCWSKHSETDAMWRCYSYENRALRIRTTDEKLLKHVETIYLDQKTTHVYLREVIYDLNKNSAFHQQICQMRNSLLPHEPYFHKRPAFRHEGEYRILVSDDNSYGCALILALDVKASMNEFVQNKTDEQIIDYLSKQLFDKEEDLRQIAAGKDEVQIKNAGDITEYIDSVMVHPKAPIWYVDIIREICQLKHIKFDGKSNIYELK